MGKKKKIEDVYKKLTQIEHVLKRPGMYIGSVDQQNENTWVLDKDDARIVQENIVYSPGLIKLFDEILTNAMDEKTRNKSVTQIKVDIDQETGGISVYNNGTGIPVVMHKDHKMYVPELIFGELLSGTSFDDDSGMVTGGTHGLGAKLTAIYSKYFEVETLDSKRGLKFKQIFEDNLSKRSNPKITEKKGNGYTKITFFPDYDKFGYKGLDNENYKVIKKRVYDACATTPKDVSIYFNDEKIDIRSFDKYIDLYIGDNEETPRVHDKCNDRWEFAVCQSKEGFQQISFVNGVPVPKGGTHVKYILDQLVKKLVDIIQKKHKDITIKEYYIRDKLWIFVNSIIENIKFTSQTKEELTTPKSKFGSTCIITDDFAKKVAKMGIEDEVISFAEYKESKNLEKGETGKRKTIAIPKLEDANWAGTKKSNECTLILTEGDSAKAFAISGLSVIGRNKYGVYPLKGKILNVRDAGKKQVADNKEFTELKKILALKQGEKYKNVDKLRYGSILILTDADVDGSHIKGLLFNLFEYFWEDLLKLNIFIRSLVTPIIKTTHKKKKNEVLEFYTNSDYDDWKKKVNIHDWNIKYYKGLGTSSAKEAKEIFKKLEDTEIQYIWDSTKDKKAIELAFNKKMADERKKWLSSYDKSNVIDSDQREITYDEFIDRELIHFSNSDNIRSIPSICDGLKPSQRKILYSAFKRNLTKEIKVAQFAGYISEHSAYHHGEASLMKSIISMAQDFVGSQNINVFSPNGQFGTRLMGGKDASSPRYIFTNLSKITSSIFNEIDKNILNYLDDDGFKIEPEWYIPIIPMILVNGCDGIGTGFSTKIPPFNPDDIISNLVRHMEGKPLKNMIPWYRDFKGKIVEIADRNYLCEGKYIIRSDTLIEITELPIGTWTDDYKQYIESMIIDKKDKNKKKGQFIQDYENHSTEAKINFIVKISSDYNLHEWETKMHEYGINTVQKKFKLASSISTKNMHAYNSEGKIIKYTTPEKILTDFYDVRLEHYRKRRTYLIQKFKRELKLLDSKAKFILGVIESKIIVSNQKKAVIYKRLKELKFPKYSELGLDENEVEEDSNEDYNYLIKMPIYTLTKEKVDELKSLISSKRKELNIVEKKAIKVMWIEDLNNFIDSYSKYI